MTSSLMGSSGKKFSHIKSKAVGTRVESTIFMYVIDRGVNGNSERGLGRFLGGFLEKICLELFNTAKHCTFIARYDYVCLYFRVTTLKGGMKKAASPPPPYFRHSYETLDHDNGLINPITRGWAVRISLKPFELLTYKYEFNTFVLNSYPFSFSINI